MKKVIQIVTVIILLLQGCKNISDVITVEESIQISTVLSIFNNQLKSEFKDRNSPIIDSIISYRSRFEKELMKKISVTNRGIILIERYLGSYDSYLYLFDKDKISSYRYVFNSKKNGFELIYLGNVSNKYLVTMIYNYGVYCMYLPEIKELKINYTERTDSVYLISKFRYVPDEIVSRIIFNPKDVEKQISEIISQTNYKVTKETINYHILNDLLIQINHIDSYYD